MSDAGQFKIAADQWIDRFMDHINIELRDPMPLDDLLEWAYEAHAEQGWRRPEDVAQALWKAAVAGHEAELKQLQAEAARAPHVQSILFEVELPAVVPTSSSPPAPLPDPVEDEVTAEEIVAVLNYEELFGERAELADKVARDFCRSRGVTPEAACLAACDIMRADDNDDRTRKFSEEERRRANAWFDAPGVVADALGISLSEVFWLELGRKPGKIRRPRYQAD